MRKSLSYLLVVTAFAMLAGCATPARIEQMTIRPQHGDRYSEQKALTKRVAMGAVSGGEATNPLWTSKIGDPEFRQALANSLDLAHLMAPKGKAQYKLTAELIKVDQPLVGFSLTVTTDVEYTLTRASDGTVVFKKQISAAHTATVSDAFVAGERLRLANEGSARDNITQIIDALYALKVKVATISVH